MSKKKGGRRIGVALHQEVGPPLVQAAIDHSRSLSGMATWIIFCWLKDHGYNITTADLSDWTLSHNGGGPRGTRGLAGQLAAQKAAALAQGEQAEDVNGRSETSEQDHGIHGHSDVERTPTDGQGQGDGSGTDMVS